MPDRRPIVKPSEYIKNLYARKYTHFIYKDGRGYYNVNGELIPRKEFEKKHPLKIGLNKHNRDKRKAWMDDVKSY